MAFLCFIKVLMLEQALQQGIAPAIVVAIYLIAVKIVDSRKENSQVKLTSTLIKSINDISAFLENITKNIIDKDKEKCRNAVRATFMSTASNLSHFVIETIINNHIDVNKENVLQNIHTIVSSSYYSIKTNLSIYKYGDNSIVYYLQKEWIDELEQDMINVIYNKHLSNEDKILAYVNKVELKVNGYITYLINNAIKD